MINHKFVSYTFSPFFTFFPSPNLNFGVLLEKWECSLGSDRNFGSVRGSAGFGRFGSAKILPNFLAFNFLLTYNIRV